MKRRIATLLVVLGVVAAACGDVTSDGPSGIRRVPPTSTSVGPVNGIGDPDVSPPAIVEPCIPPEVDLEPYCRAFEYQQGSMRIVWDRWFWGQGMFSRGTVEVFEGNDLLLSGPFASDSVMRQETNGDFTFLDESGGMITVVTQQEIGPIIEAALVEAGIGNGPS